MVLLVGVLVGIAIHLACRRRSNTGYDEFTNQSHDGLAGGNQQGYDIQPHIRTDGRELNIASGGGNEQGHASESMEMGVRSSQQRDDQFEEVLI